MSPSRSKNGEIVHRRERAYCRRHLLRQAKRSRGSIATSFDAHLAGCDEVIDATGKYVFPGFIDPHVHIYLPFMGTFAKDTHETASRAALVGGTTTLIEMICPGCEEKPLEAFELWLGKAQGASACDFTFHMGVTRYDDEAERDFREIVRRGVSSFKVFLAYKGAFGVTDEQLYNTLTLAKSLGVITTAHCENADLVAELQKKLLAEGKTGPGMALLEPAAGGRSGRRASPHDVRRDDRRACLHRASELRRSAARGDVAARQRGVNVWVETLIQYLLLDRTDAEKPDFEGAKAVMSPPLRDKKNQEVLWNGLRQRLHLDARDRSRAVRFRDAKTHGPR